MKVKIRKYSTWWGPYQAMETVFFWAKTKDEYGFTRSADWVHDTGEWYADTWLGRIHIWLANKYQSWQESRRVNVHIDSWDVWSMDTTLAEIILPMLRMLRDKKHGAPNVDPLDVPENLRPGKLEIEQYNTDGTTDALFFKRWDWVMDEMIFAFENKVDDSWEHQFHTGNHDIEWKPVDAEGNSVDKENAKYFEMTKGPNDTHVFDREGYTAYQDRISNGLRLFGKYYSSLWD